MKVPLKLSPLLILYLVAIILFHPATLVGDESGYLHFASNLTHGYYADKDSLDLWWGPGYPLVLMPFVAINAPVLIMRLLNAFFLFFAALYFYHTIRYYIDDKYILAFAFLFGLYPPTILISVKLYSESLALFLVCGFVYHFTRCINLEKLSISHTVLCSLYLAMIALTKVIFGYVIGAVFILSAGAFCIYRSSAYKRSFVIMCLALMVCSPYLIYTYSVTGKVFYWSNSGGMSLYWMSTPYGNEYGDWHTYDEVDSNANLWNNHHLFFTSLQGLNKVEADDIYKATALHNISSYPSKYAFNVLCNLGRMCFSYPFSYTDQKPSTYIYMLPNMIVIVFMFMSIFLIITGSVIIPVEFTILLLIITIYFIGSSLLSAYARMFNIALPVILPIILFTIKRYTIRVNN